MRTRGGAPRNSTVAGSGVIGRDAEDKERRDCDESSGVASWIGDPDASAVFVSVINCVDAVCCCEPLWLGDVAGTLAPEGSSTGESFEGTPSVTIAVRGTSAALPTNDPSCPVTDGFAAFDAEAVGVKLLTGDEGGQPRSGLGAPVVTVGRSTSGAFGVLGVTARGA